MKSMYKKLRDYIEPCDLLNDKEEITLLQGISNEKYFQACKSNTNDIDLSRYRICRKGWFAYNRATTRNGDKISIAYRDGEDCLVSPSYKCFRIKDENELNPYYLMLWFKRPQFDRYARFRSHGSAHEYFEYDEMCEVELPIPSIEEQLKIVEAYQTLEHRIELKRQINDNLEAQAYTIYKDWFIDNGEQHGAINCFLSDVFEIHDSRRIPLSSQERAERAKIYPYYGAAGLLDYVDNYLFDGIYVLMGEDGSVVTEQGYPYLQYIWGQFWVNNHAHILQGKNGISTEALYLILSKTNIKEFVTGAVQAKMSQENLRSIPTITLNQDELVKFDAIIQPIFALIRNNRCEIEKLEELKKQIQGKLSSSF